MKKSRHRIAIAFFACLCMSCLQVGNELISWTDQTKDDEAIGKYHFLEDSGIKVFLPTIFEEKSLYEFQKILKKNLTPELATIEINRLNKLKDAEGELYVFYDAASKATVTVNSVPFQPMSRQDAQYFLGMIRQQMELGLEEHPVTVEKIASQYKGKSDDYVFKCVYKFTNTAENFENYSTTFFITHNLQTVFINLSSGFNAHFDPYALKTIM
ncbi:hypothetical protein G5B37_00370 [Rasiella rasia]|uniref:DUF1795 domain-containing protein n=1 Tax=Rasiella rasia TaxID=2744027 RepID=A0A6G6GHR9_9FLAO|nr:hypothetical protein [Rasiella rasia]QIE58074.1 hypothetical protein G5B37_00370 [Rasiella rasia]